MDFELATRRIEQDLEQAKQRKKKQVQEEYEEIEDLFPDIGENRTSTLNTRDLLLAKRDKEHEDDDIELDEAEIQAYINLQRAQKLIEQHENPDAPTIPSALLRYNEPVMKEVELKNSRNKIALSEHLPWVHTMALTSIKRLEVKNVEDDIEREMAFYEQALLTAKDACNRLKELGIPTIRPDDYFAEMVKSDEHMLKVKDKLLYSRKVLEEREQRRRQREQKKLGKQMQVNRLKEKLEEKKSALEAIKYWRKEHGGKGKEFDLEKLETEMKQLKNEQKAQNTPKRPKPTDKKNDKKGPNKKGFNKGATKTIGSKDGSPGKGLKPKSGPKGIQKKRPGKNARNQRRK